MDQIQADPNTLSPSGIMPDAMPPTAAPAAPLMKSGDIEPTDDRKALVKKWQEKVEKAKKFFERRAFKRMRDDQKFAGGKQWPGMLDDQTEDDQRYIANITQRAIQQFVSSLYAKNPTFRCKRRTTLDFSIWDESGAMAQSIQTNIANSAAQTGQPQIDPQIQDLMTDMKNGMQKRAMLDKVAKTAQIMMNYFIDRQQPPFKRSMKQAVRRACTTGAGYVKLGYVRDMRMRPEDVETTNVSAERLATIDELIADQTEGTEEYCNLEAEREQLRILLDNLQNCPQVIDREGIVLDFPRSTSIIVDQNCTHLCGFVGARFIVHEFVLSVDDIKKIYRVDLKKGQYKSYSDSDVASQNSGWLDPKNTTLNQDDRCCVWEIQSKDDGMVYVVADGYFDFLKEPSNPDITLDRFWNIFCLSFNEMENEFDIYPPSDVRLMMPQQREYNRMREALRQQRYANRPALVTVSGKLEDEDEDALTDRPDNAVIKLKGLLAGEKVSDVIQPLTRNPIDPAIYDTNPVFEDIQRVTGQQAANIGGTSSNTTATQSGIAQSSLDNSTASKVDDLDDMLCELAIAMGEVLFAQIDPATAKKIAGPGAVWPQLTAQQVADELIMEVQAGSSGLPNKSANIAALQAIAPIMMQTPGFNPEWLAKTLIDAYDASIDPTDALISGIQSIMAMNSQKQLAAGPPGSNPNLQGSEGAQNAPAPAAQHAPAPPGAPMGAPHPATQAPGAAMRPAGV